MKSGWGKIHWPWLLAALAAAITLLAPAVILLAAGGWLGLLGLAGLVCWLPPAIWVWQAWRDWRRGRDDYV